MPQRPPHEVLAETPLGSTEGRRQSARAALSQALREAEERYRTVVANAAEAIWIVDAAGTLTWLNRRAEELSGVWCEDWIGRSLSEVVAEADRPALARVLAGVTDGRPAAGEVRILRKEGSAWLAKLTAVPLLSGTDVPGAVVFGTDVTEAREARRQLERRTNDLEVINAVSRAVTDSLDLYKVLDGALSSVLGMMEMRPKGGIFVLDDPAGPLRLVVHRGLAADFVAREVTVELGECLCGHVAQSGELLCSENCASDPRHSRPWGDDPHSHVIVPLTAHGRVQGILFLYPEATYRLTEPDRRLFATLGGQIGVAIENARLYQSTDAALRLKVAELTSSLREVEIQRARAAEVEHKKDEFVAMLSHDLRSPLSALLLQAGRVERRAGADPALREIGQAIQRCGRRIEAMVADLVDSARLESGHVTLPRRVQRLDALAHEAVQLLSPDDRARVDTVFDEAAPAVLADPASIERVLTNLLTNALKFSPPETRVAVEIRAGHDGALVEVRDAGPGIEPEHLPHIFERFYRASQRIAVDGAGLGLYIARLLVEAHGGRIWAKSTPGAGAVLAFTLPAAPDAPAG